MCSLQVSAVADMEMQITISMSIKWCVSVITFLWFRPKKKINIHQQPSSSHIVVIYLHKIHQHILNRWIHNGAHNDLRFSWWLMLTTVIIETPHKQKKQSVQASQPSSGYPLCHILLSMDISAFLLNISVDGDLSGCHTHTHLKMHTSCHRCQGIKNSFGTCRSAVSLICIVPAFLTFFWPPRHISSVSQSASKTAFWLLIWL